VCGGANDRLENRRCYQCFRDWQGFLEQEFKPAAAMQLMAVKRQALGSLLVETSASQNAVLAQRGEALMKGPVHS
jgi:hypothetical protein